MLKFAIIPSLVKEEITDELKSRVINYTETNNVRLLFIMNDGIESCTDLAIDLAKRSTKTLNIIIDGSDVCISINKCRIIYTHSIVVSGITMALDKSTPCDIRVLSDRVTGVNAGIIYQNEFVPTNEHVITTFASITRSEGKIHSIAARPTLYMCELNDKLHISDTQLLDPTETDVIHQAKIDSIKECEKLNTEEIISVFKSSDSSENKECVDTKTQHVTSKRSST